MGFFCSLLDARESRAPKQAVLHVLSIVCKRKFKENAPQRGTEGAEWGFDFIVK